MTLFESACWQGVGLHSRITLHWAPYMFQCLSDINSFQNIMGHKQNFKNIYWFWVNYICVDNVDTGELKLSIH